MATTALVLEERLLSEATRHKGQRGLVVGSVVAGRALALQLVPCVAADGLDTAARCEHLQRWLVGGVRVLGAWGDADKVTLKHELCEAFTVKAAREGLRHAYILCTSASPPTAVRVEVPVRAGAPWEDGVATNFTTAPLLRECTLYRARLMIRLDVEAPSGGVPLGVGVESAAGLLARTIRNEVVLSTANGQSSDAALAEVWTQDGGPVAVRSLDGAEAKPLLSAVGAISAFAFAHKDCTPEQRASFLLSDLCSASVMTRVAVMLDELDAVDEELPQQRRGKEHLLARTNGGATSAPDPRARWTLPRRVLIVGSSPSVPFCDWQMPWEYNGEATQERFREMVGLEADKGMIDDEMEKAPPNAQLLLSGFKAAGGPVAAPAPSASARPDAKQVSSKPLPQHQQPILFVFVGFIGLLLGLIWWHLFY
jgi:hypothetical protein